MANEKTQTWDGILKELKGVVGEERVITDPEILEGYSKDKSFVPPKMPDCVVKVKSTAEVQSVMKIANQYLIPVVPRSSQCSFYGCGIPEEGGIILDLSGMKGILRTDQRNRWVLIEPGVTFGQLQEEMKKIGFQALNPFLPHKDKSVISSVLEKDPVAIPKIHFDEPVRTMQIILPTGDLLRTGAMGMALEDPVKTPEDSWSDLTATGGPGLDWWRLLTGASGTFAITTLMNVKIVHLPKMEQVYFLPFHKLSDLIDPYYTIQRKEIGNESFVLNQLNLASILGDDPDDIKRLKKVLPPFTVIVNVTGGQYFPEEKIGYEKEALEEIASHFLIGASTSLLGVAEADLKMKEMLKMPWSKDVYWKDWYKGSSVDILFLATLDQVDEFTSVLYRVAGEYDYPHSDIGIYIQPKQRARICHIEYTLPYNLQDEVEKERVKAFYLAASEALITQGAFFHRPYGPWAEMVFSRTGNVSTVLKKVKEIIDPNRVLNPGKLNL
jgi:hypothetical protein